MKVEFPKIKFPILLLCFLYIFEYTLYGQSVSGLKYIIQVLCIIVFLCRERNIIAILPKDPVILLLVVTFGAIPISQAAVKGSLTISIYTVIMWTFIICTYCIGKQLHNEEKRQDFAKMFAWTGTIIVAICVALNYSNLLNFQAIMTNFGTESNIILDMVRRERSAFGFMHVNSLGGICVAIIIALEMAKYKSNAKRIIRNVAIAFIFLVMLNTGSRASVYGTLIFFLIIVGERMYFKSPIVFKFLMKILITIGILAGAAWVVNLIQNDFEFVSKLTSGRIDGWLYDLSQMKKDGTLLFGYGLYNPTSFFQQSFAGKMIVDNWFVYMITNIGLVGLAGCLALICFIAHHLIACCATGNTENQKVMALYIANMFHAMAEKAFITPADPISFFMMVMIFGTLYGNNKCK